MIGKRLRKIIWQLLLIICTLTINLNCKKQVILLMIPNEKKEGWYYSAVKELSTLLWGTTSKHYSDF